MSIKHLHIFGTERKIMRPMMMVAGLGLALSAVAHATVLTFDDLPAGTDIPDLYHGYIFSQPSLVRSKFGPEFQYARVADPAGGGQRYGAVSGANTLISVAQGISFVRPGLLPFTVKEFHLTAATEEGLAVRIELFDGAGGPSLTTSAVLSTAVAMLFTFNQKNVSGVRIQGQWRAGAVLPDFHPSNAFVIDSIRLQEQVVPEPGTAWTAALVLLLCLCYRTKRRRPASSLCASGKENG